MIPIIRQQLRTFTTSNRYSHPSCLCLSCYKRSPRQRKMLSQDEALPPPASWPNRPILVKRAADSLSSAATDEERRLLLQPLSIHLPRSESVIALDNDMFQGTMMLIVKGISDAPEGYFDAKKRQFEIVVQGRFKKEIPGSKLYTGQCFNNRIVQAPWLIQSILYLIRGFLRDIEVEAEGPKQYIISPVLTTTQRMQASLPGEEPCISNADAVAEDLSLHGEAFSCLHSPEDRKAYFSDAKNLRAFTFSKDFVYTFVSYQHIVSLADFEFLLGLVNIDILNIIGAAPLQIMAVYFDPDVHRAHPPDSWSYLYNVEVWHERSFTHEDS